MVNQTQARQDHDLNVTTFSYLEIEATALARVEGSWTGDRLPPRDLMLVIRADGGRHAAEQIVDPASGGAVERGAWRAAFSVPLHLVEAPSAWFSLAADGLSLPLGRPVRHEPAAAIPREAPVDPSEPDRVAALETQVVELRAALAEAKDARAAAEARKRQLAHELTRVQAESAATITRLRNELKSYRASGRDDDLSLPGDPRRSLPHADLDLSLDDEFDLVGFQPRGDAEAEPSAPTGDPVQCTACDATGLCPRCDGRGKRYGRRCTECDGRGHCTTCGGPGFRWVDGRVARRAG
jgi:hypothetical protein